MTKKGSKRVVSTVIVGADKLNKAISVVRKFGEYSGHITLPGAWVGKRVEVRILEE